MNMRVRVFSLMAVKPIMALNCGLQINYVKSDCVESHDEPWPLAFRSLCFLSASQISFASNCTAPLIMRQRHLVR